MVVVQQVQLDVWPRRGPPLDHVRIDRDIAAALEDLHRHGEAGRERVVARTSSYKA